MGEKERGREGKTKSFRISEEIWEEEREKLRRERKGEKN